MYEASPKRRPLSEVVKQAPQQLGHKRLVCKPQEQQVAVVLAAGSGTRFHSETPKVIYPLDGKPLVRHVVEAVEQVDVPTVVIVGHEGSRVMKALADKNVIFIEQTERLGTAHAVYLAQYALPEQFDGDIIVLYADVPGVDKHLLQAVLERKQNHRRADPTFGALVVTGSRSLSLMSASGNYGRIVRDEQDPLCIREIVEKKQIDSMPETNPRKRMLADCDEFNSGIFVARAPALFRALGSVLPHRVGQHRCEYYATDFVEHMVAYGLHVYAWQVPAALQFKIEGANTLEEVHELERRLRTQSSSGR